MYDTHTLSLADMAKRCASYDEAHNPASPEHEIRVQSLVHMIETRESSIPIMEAAIKVFKARREALNYRLLESMDDLEQQKVSLANGLKLEVKASPSPEYGLPEDASDEAKDEAKGRLIAWLVDHGDAASVKEIITLKGGVNHELIEQIESDLQALGVDYTRNPQIHPQTLKKILRDRLLSGELPPPEVATLKLHRYVTVS